MPSYNNYYPATYQPPVAYPQYQQAVAPTPQVSMATQPQQGIQWVQGEIGARAYPVSPGNSTLLMDSDENKFYIKSADSSGMPLPLRVFSYTEEVATQHSHDDKIDTSNFITREEFEEWKEAMKPSKKEGK